MHKQQPYCGDSNIFILYVLLECSYVASYHVIQLAFIDTYNFRHISSYILASYIVMYIAKANSSYMYVAITI